MIDVEVAFATIDYQKTIAIKVLDGTSVEQAINKSEILMYCPEINLVDMPVGIFGKVCQLDKVLEQDDRVEIYRPLYQHPMDARRNRAKKG